MCAAIIAALATTASAFPQHSNGSLDEDSAQAGPAGGGGGAWDSGGPAAISGAMRKWQLVTLTFDGPNCEEKGSSPQNPFLDWRLNVEFTGPGGQVLTVPGFFDGNGNGGDDGQAWRVRFVPDERGRWSYKVSFRKGADVAVSLSPTAGNPIALDGAVGWFDVGGSDPQAPGFAKWGLLEDVGEHYLKFRDGPYFIKGGVDSPENFLAYHGFDNTKDQTGGASTVTLESGIHHYKPHVADWNVGDPNFVSAETGTNGKGIIGALNYLGSKGVNSVYFLPMNQGGDGRDTVPFTGYAKNTFDKTHYDISKLRQWNKVFQHAQEQGIMLHVVLGETESGNENWLDNGSLGRERKLFYREMSARFGHILALKWNLSEENDFSTTKLRQFADYIDAVDPYDHPIAFHTHILPQSGGYGPYSNVMGDKRFAASSIQTDPQHAGAHVEYWRNRTQQSGRRWVVDIDELTPASTGLTDWNADDLRKESLYDVLFSGGNIEWYCGYHTLPLGGDLRLEDFRTREAMWDYMRYAREFLQNYTPFWQMQPMDGLVTGESPARGGAEVFAKPGETYAIYYPNASATGKLDLTGHSGKFAARWFDPRTGRFPEPFFNINGGGQVSVGSPPATGGGGSTVFLEKNGLVVMEVESTPKVSSWVEETKWGGFTGQSYYRWNGPDYFGQPGNAPLSYEFEITNAGNYQFRLHNRHNHPLKDQENDCWVRVDGGPWRKVYSNKGSSTINVWNWESKFDLSPAPHVDANYTLSAGVHILEISARSKNFMIDRMHLFNSSVTNPLNKNLAQSPTGTSGGGTNEDWVLLVMRP